MSFLVIITSSPLEVTFHANQLGKELMANKRWSAQNETGNNPHKFPFPSRWNKKLDENGIWDNAQNGNSKRHIF